MLSISSLVDTPSEISILYRGTASLSMPLFLPFSIWAALWSGTPSPFTPSNSGAMPSKGLIFLFSQSLNSSAACSSYCPVMNDAPAVESSISSKVSSPNGFSSCSIPVSIAFTGAWLAPSPSSVGI